MAPAGRVNGALFAAAPGPGCPGPTRTHPGRQRRKETEMRERQRWRETEVGRDSRQRGRAVDEERKTLRSQEGETER